MDALVLHCRERAAQLCRLEPLPLASCGVIEPNQALGCPALTACSTSARTSASGEAFTYTVARGITITLDRYPGTVVAQSSVAAALWDNNYKGAGIYADLPDPLDYQTGNIDPSTMTVLGTTWGEFNIEKYAALSQTC
ncbi:hypothetical protein HT102_01140 [Hoyosella sp. G463]|uniref:Uncharacterized protein n=1 Tax=Lolliginicoccus lacisalsi TaxID=2742202 RepID=A0A927J9K2_9ACTN|nr:hypothetical protein [Lolliginicoccus lacisalsi]MBD8505094.1 hypothetical protein [Lolliginicoccus lacisalsi]